NWCTFFSVSEAVELMSSVSPSGADLATNSAPMKPLAPGRFSTITGWLQSETSLGSMMRASVSAPPPGGNGTTTRTRFQGRLWPSRAAEAKSRAAAAAPTLLRPHAVLIRRPRSHALVDEFLHALAFVGLRRIQVALRIDRDAVHAVELPRLAPAVSEIRDFL